MSRLIHNHFLLFFIVSLIVLSSSIPKLSAMAAGATNTEFIRTSCETTSYPRLCFNSLSSHARFIRADPQLMAHTALTVTLQTAQSTAAAMGRLARSHGLTHREIGAMRDCVEELSESVDELRESLGEMKQLRGRDFEMKMNDIQTWVSAALTDDDTCTDGFAGKVTRRGVKTAVRGKIMKVAHLTSNALALINRFAQLHG
ncbi:PREDICTED: 21 kDa protein-like [Ipomoea nil]|uniref:21 kDa protein-like n=1 Tax=Ipomoea nil TaxID=35883 RepID=UPI000901D385|nr:PREDICTED: 21 kDa protein-like [Ipomoea nil]